ncbi:protein kinase [bacterium]|nr:protein kinase [bacterium]
MISAGSPPEKSPDRLVPGQILDNKYAVKELVGRGGMGTVYRVRDWDWNVDLAVKVPAHHVISDWVAKERFVLEAQTWIELGVHPNIVQCWFVREYEGHPLVFMDYLPAGSLKEWKADGRVKPGHWEQILDLMIQACAGLGYAHELGLIHRDVKPANLLMREDGRLCVTDFGLVKVTQLEESISRQNPDWERLLREVESRGREDSLISSLTLTGTGTLLGTPEYGAPEQWMAAGSVGATADVYALGGVLYELCTGRRPFDDGVKRVSTAVMLGDHLMTPAPDPRQFRPDVPARLAELSLRCLEKDPLQRPATMAEVRAQLEDLYHHIAGRPYPRPAPKAGAQRADALNNKAVSLWYLGFSQKAFEAWREASKLDGLHPETVYNRTMIQWRQGQIKDEEVMRRLIQVKSAYPHLGLYLGYYYLDLGSPKLAEQEILEALAYPLTARHGSAWRALGDARMYLEDYEPAAHAYRQALQRIPEDREAQSRLEMAQLGQRQRQRILFPRVTPHQKFDRKGPIQCVGLSSDGLSAVSWVEDTLELWNTQDGSTQWVWRGDRGAGSPARLSIETDWVLSLDSPRGRCWSRHTGQLLLELEDRKRFLAVLGQPGWALIGGETLEQVELPGGSPLQALQGHIRPITCAALGSDGKLGISGSGDRTARLWDLEQGLCLHVLEGHTDLIETVLLSPDGALAFSGSRDKTVRIWQVATGDCLFVLPHEQEVRRMRLSRDGRYVLVGSWSLGGKDQLDCWEVATGQRLYGGPGGHWICAYQGGPWALIASRVARPGPLRLWDVPTGRILCNYSDHPGEVTALSLSRDERWALSGCSDGGLRLWEVDWGARASEFSLVVNRTSDHNQVESTQQRFLDHLNRSHQLCLGDDPAGAYRCLTLARSLPGYTRDPAALDLNADLLQSLSRRRIQAVWQIRSFASQGPVGTLQLSTDGRLAVSSSGRVLYLWELSSGSCLRGFTGHADAVTAIALSQGDQLAASVSLDGSLRLWNLKSGECLQVFKFNQPLVAVCIDQHGHILAASREHFYRCQSGVPQPLFSGPAGPLDCLVQSRNGRLALTASNEPNSLTLWKLPACQPFRPWRGRQGHPDALGDGSATSLALSGDGRFALVSDGLGWLRIFDIEDGTCKIHWQAHHQPIDSVALSHDGRVAMSASKDGTVGCWDVVSGQNWESLHSPGAAGTLAVSPDARFVLTAGADRMLRLWELDWELNPEKQASSLIEAWKKSTVLDKLGTFFRKRSPVKEKLDPV